MKQKKIVYFGNKLSIHGKSKSVIETLEPLLNEICSVKTFSNKANKLARLIDMVFRFFTHGLFANKIIIDVFSASAFYFAFILGLLSFLFGKKYILFLHGGNLPNRYISNPKLVNFLFNKAYKIIAPSNYLKSFFVENGFEVEYIPNIIELEKFPFKERKKIQPKLISIRGFGKDYNPSMTIKAIELVQKKYPTIELLMLGNSDEVHYIEVIELIKKLELENNIEVHAKLSVKEWLDKSSEYDIMISNPNIDNTPISIIEGMALGMCVISTNVGGIPYLLVDKQDAILVDKNNEQQLSEAIIQLIEDENISNKLSKEGRKKSETFDWKNIKPLWQKIIES